MPTSTSPLTARLARWILLSSLMALAWSASGESADESKHIAKYGAMPFDSRYLYPGGEVVLSIERLSQPFERIMVLTFDDGPDERDLEIAALLKKRHLPAAFFYVGSRVETLPGVVKEMAAANHEIGFHAYRHHMLSWQSATRLAEDFRQGLAVLANLGISSGWFRPPYGDFNANVVRAAKERGLETILWTIDSRDWTGVSAATMAQRVIRQFHPGAVLLFHSIHANTLQALPEVLAAAEREHYRFVSLREWRQTILAANCRAEGRSCSTAVAEAPGTTTTATPDAKPPAAPAVVARTIPVKPEPTASPAPPIVAKAAIDQSAPPSGPVLTRPAIQEEEPDSPMAGVGPDPQPSREEILFHLAHEGTLPRHGSAMYRAMMGELLEIPKADHAEDTEPKPPRRSDPELDPD